MYQHGHHYGNDCKLDFGSYKVFTLSVIEELTILF